MTIAAGFRCPDGMLVCADSQITGPVRLCASKIWEHHLGHVHLLAVSAGERVLALRAEEDITAAIRRDMNLRAVRTAVEDVMKRLHQDYIDPRCVLDSAYGLDLLTAIRTDDGFDLLELDAAGVSASVKKFKCLGSGAAIAEYLADMLFREGSTAQYVVPTAVHLLQQAQRYDPSCGLGSEIKILTQGGHIHPIRAETTSRLEKFFEDLYVALRPLLATAVNAELMSGSQGHVLDPGLRALEQVIRSMPPMPFPDLRRVLPTDQHSAHTA